MLLLDTAQRRIRAARLPILLLGISALLAGCGSSAEESGATESFHHDVSRLEQRTTPPGAASHVTTEPAGRSGIAEAAWRVDSHMPWVEYSLWVRGQLASEMDVDTSMARVLKGVEASSTDIFYLKLAPDSLDSEVVLVQLSAVPR